MLYNLSEKKKKIYICTMIIWMNFAEDAAADGVGSELPATGWTPRLAQGRGRKKPRVKSPGPLSKSRQRLEAGIMCTFRFLPVSTRMLQQVYQLAAVAV